MKISAVLMLTVSYAWGAVSAILGWLTLGQVALHYASRRIVHGEGAVGHVDPLYRPSKRGAPGGR
jgi:hypothetical protein